MLPFYQYYFGSFANSANDDFKRKWATYAKVKKLPGADNPLTNDPMEATYIGINMWKQAVEKAKTTDVDRVIEAMAGQSYLAPDGFVVQMDEKNHHLRKPLFVGELRANGHFEVVWSSRVLIKAQPWSPFIPGNRNKRDEPNQR